MESQKSTAHAIFLRLRRKDDVQTILQADLPLTGRLSQTLAKQSTSTNRLAPAKHMKIEQKKFSNVHTFDFKDRFLNFAYKDKSGSGDVDVAYANLSSKSSIRIENNTWWKNVGYIWCGIGVVNIGMGIAAGESAAGRGFWLLMGLICLGVYHATRVKYTVIGFEGGNLFVIQDGKTHDQVVSELMSRRKAQLLSLYGEVDLESSLDRERAKFEYLKEQGVISQEEADEKIRQATLALGVITEAPQTLN
ncbi:hypothetical protein DFR39_11273 [Roseateles asaccharophilus]|uniref:Uncharacterized protein n=2 Tax=Roseateles asaccharophilus TaxID=582607 RepID=A0A4R6MT05_9BURK|nr:hypothetical protein DFR39_11273 [Roseateles asaccharophilus]